MFVFVVFIYLLLYLPCTVHGDACDDLGLSNNTNNNTVAIDDSCFEMPTTGLYFIEARTSCTRHATGHLAILNATQIDVLPTSGKLIYSYYWIGLMQLPNSTEPDGGWNWIWNNGMIPAVNIPWYNGEPNGVGSSDCAILFPAVAAILDTACSGWNAFMCQYHNLDTTTTSTTTTSSTTTTTPTTTSSTTTTTPTTTSSTTTTTTPTTTSSTTTTTPTTTSSTTTTTPTTTSSTTTTTLTTTSTSTTNPTTTTSTSTTHPTTTSSTTTTITDPEVDMAPSNESTDQMREAEDSVTKTQETDTTQLLTTSKVCNPIEAFARGQVIHYSNSPINKSYAHQTVAKIQCNNSQGIQNSTCLDGIWLPHPAVMCKPPMKKATFYIPYEQKNKQAVGKFDILANITGGTISNFGMCAEKCVNTAGCTAYGWSSDVKHCQLYQTFVSEMTMVESPGYKIAERADVDELK